MTLPARGTWTTLFDQERTRADGSKYVHGGLDIAPVDRSNFKDAERDLYAIEGGQLMAVMTQLGTEDRLKWSAYGRVPWPGALFNEPFPFANYTVEFYGIILVLLTQRRSYVYAHLNSVPHFLDGEMQMVFEREGSRYVHSTLWGPVNVVEGSYVGQMGWFGKVEPGDRRGCHLHIEGHEGRVWHPEANRVRLEKELKEAHV